MNSREDMKLGSAAETLRTLRKPSLHREPTKRESDFLRKLREQAVASAT
jgi:hypothetical protein